MKLNIYIKNALLGVLLLTGFSGCKKDFLEVIPKGMLIPTTTEDFNLLMNYSGYYYSNAGLYQPAMLMGDEMSAEIEKFNTTSFIYPGYFFKWQDDIFIPSTQQNSSFDRPAFLSGSLSNIYSLNAIINNVMDATEGTGEKKADILGQALASRAFINFQLINYFAKPYSSQTASSDPGFPMITTDDVRRTDFSRGTVQQAYDFIIDDLKRAIDILKISPEIQTRMSKPAAEALLGKVYLFMNNSEQALVYLNLAMDHISSMRVKPRLYDYNIELAPGGSFYPINAVNGPNSPFANMTDLTESIVARISYNGTNRGTGYGNDFLTISPKTVNLYQPDDWRLKLYSDKTREQNPIPVASGGPIRLKKYGLTYARIGMELSELYLLRAEAYARLGNLNQAKEDVEFLRKKRMPIASANVPTEAMADKKSLVSFIMDERIREFAAQGHRWFDMRRLSVDPLFSGLTFDKHQLYGTDGLVLEEYTLDPKRLTLRIPKPYLDAHPEMVDNP